MRNPFRKRIKIIDGCECEGFCPCKTPQLETCEDCKFYRWIDSGYGHCIALPTAITVPWCKIPCSLFKL